MTYSRTPKCVAAETSGDGRGALAPMMDWNDVGETGHIVQFYDRDEFLIDSVAEFTGAGFRAGDAAIVIATAAHRAALEEKLRLRGVDVGALREQGRYLPFDAAETLAKFMVGDMPDAVLFREIIGGVVAQAGQNRRRVRAFGEMVALLWSEGRGPAAIALEELWNKLADERPFALLCAYPMSAFAGTGDGRMFHQVCCTHGRVIPAESYTAHVGEDARLRAISALQQKASTLEAEIEERKRAECAEREQHTKLAVAVAIAHLGIWELDMISYALTCSEQCRAHFGLAAHESLSYAELLQRIHPQDRVTVESELQRTITDGCEYAVEFRIILPSGQTRWLASMGRCVHNGTHRLLGVTFDVTARRENAELLERTVIERTAELRATVSELETFSYSISHDMRAPLRSMQGFADILMKDLGEKLDSESRSYLERICAAGQRMDRLIQDVLTFSRVTRAELKLEPISLDHLVRGVLECYPNLQPPSAEINIEGSLPAVMGNAAALTQCISNLLGNAVKFVAPGTEPSVRLWAEIIDREPPPWHGHLASPRMVRVYVKDNGIGIPASACDKIFGIFHRLAKDYDGTGIGLAIVKKAAERMGGGVGVTSELGKGSTFWLDLPLADHAI